MQQRGQPGRDSLVVALPALLRLLALRGHIGRRGKCHCNVHDALRWHWEQITGAAVCSRHDDHGAMQGEVSCPRCSAPALTLSSNVRPAGTEHTWGAFSCPEVSVSPCTSRCSISPGGPLPGDDKLQLRFGTCQQAARVHRRAKTRGQGKLVAPSPRAEPLKWEQAAQSPPAGSREKQREQREHVCNSSKIRFLIQETVFHHQKNISP